VEIPYATLYRFAPANLGFGGKAPTLPVADGELGKELDLNTGWMTLLEPDDRCVRRQFKTFIFTPNTLLSSATHVSHISFARAGNPGSASAGVGLIDPRSGAPRSHSVATTRPDLTSANASQRPGNALTYNQRRRGRNIETAETRTVNHVTRGRLHEREKRGSLTCKNRQRGSGRAGKMQ
jgi:hypothetical protein